MTQNGATSRVVALGFDAVDPAGLARWWAAALGWDVGDERGPRVALVPTDGTRFTVVFQPTTAAKGAAQNRLHLDLTTTSLDDQNESVERLIRLGGRHIDIGQRDDEKHVVLADPEGNELCIIEPTNNFLAGCGRFGSITCDGTREVGYFWSAALGWPLVWDQDEETERAHRGEIPSRAEAPPTAKAVIEEFARALTSAATAQPQSVSERL